MAWIRENRGLISGIASAAFTGAWLLLVCQTCLAAYADTPSAGTGSQEEHCRHGEEPVSAQEPVMASNHCIDNCDCNAPALMVSTAQPARADKGIETDNKKFGAVDPSLSLSLNHHADNFYCPRHFTPERAHYPPIERFCILLN